MWLKKINLKNVYNFGREGTPELTNFKQLNLFIGKNGSGKSNVLKAISNLDVKPFYDYESQKFSFRLWNNTNRKTNAFDSFDEKSKKDETYWSNLDLVYDGHFVKFINGIHDEGDFKSYSARYISHDDSISSFKEKLFDIEKGLYWPPTVSFSLSYIFQSLFTVQPGEIFEWSSIAGDGVPITNSPIKQFDYWSSGFLAVANLILEILQSSNKIICIDEPEIHLEPRILKRVLHIIIWLTVKETPIPNSPLASLKTSMEEEIKIWNKKWEKNNSDIRNPIPLLSPRQIFISSHSSVLINEFLNYQELSSIYEFNRGFKDSSYLQSSKSGIYHKMSRKTMLASVQKIKNYPHKILDNLGASGSDILQTNGIIWVEGPSDVIYIKKWLELYSININGTRLLQGEHYEFQMYGGSLLDSLALIKEGVPVEVEMKKLIDMISLSRNAFIVTDSDAVMKESGKIVDQSTFKKAKEFISNQIETLNKIGLNLGIWYKKDNVNIRTLEDYLDDVSKLKHPKIGKPTKKIYAQRVVENWTQSKSIEDFPHGLENEIKNLYETIKLWNK